MKVLMFPPTGARVTPEQRRAKRPIGRNVASYQNTIQELEWLAIAADERGIDNFGVTEHHLHTDGNESIPNSLLFFAKLAAKTKRIQFMPLSIVLPAHDPIRVAEDIAMFDNMYPGRVAVCFARGYVTRWMQTLTQKERIGASPIDSEANERNREIFEEYLDVVIKAWTEDSFNHNGKHYQAPYPATGIRNYPRRRVDTPIRRRRRDRRRGNDPQDWRDSQAGDAPANLDADPYVARIAPLCRAASLHPDYLRGSARKVRQVVWGLPGRGRQGRAFPAARSRHRSHAQNVHR